jgi:glutaredoxin
MKKVVLFTMKGCPHCQEMKKLLDENHITYDERDIDKFEDEYNLFVEATDNEFIPAFMLLTIEDEKPFNVELLAPDRDFTDINDACEKVKRYLN